MNLSFLSRFSKSRKSNAIFQIVDHIQKHPVFKGARIDVFTPTLHPEKLIVLLGQMHTVWKGRIGNRERKKIVNCQARLCSYYAYFEQFHNVAEFGGEGIYAGLQTSFRDRLIFGLYELIRNKLGVPRDIRLEQISSAARDILKELGAEWHQELRAQNDLKKIQMYAGAVSGQTLFSYLNDGRIRVYPIEGEKDYQNVLRGIDNLGRRIEKLEQSYEMKVVRQRGGRPKNSAELEAVKQYNALVKEFNAVIGSDVREQATLEILRKKSLSSHLVVFTMGVGHRKNYLKLVDVYLKDSKTAFLFITPPELLTNWLLLLGLPLLILLVLLLFGYYF